MRKRESRFESDSICFGKNAENPYIPRIWRDFFEALRKQLPVSSVYQVLADRLVIANDPVYVFSKGEIGAEGRDRLAPMIEALKRLVARLPEEFPWRLRIEGHSDSRPIRSNRQFESNWELSAARSVTVARYFQGLGVTPERIAATPRRTASSGASPMRTWIMAARTRTSVMSAR
mgnify:CR=1 FL=1